MPRSTQTRTGNIPGNRRPLKQRRRTKTNPQRTRLVGRNPDLSPIYANVATIPARSLASVGGTRPGRNYTRRKDRQARAQGFINFAALLHHHLAKAGRLSKHGE